MKYTSRRIGKKLISLLISGLLLFSCVAPATAKRVEVDDEGFDRPVNAHLSFNENGEFKILQVADIQDDENLEPLAKSILRAGIEKAQPDLIVLTGDNIAGYSAKPKGQSERAIRAFMSIFEEYGIPVAAVFGNHDDDGTVMTKEEEMDIYCEYDCFIGCKGICAEETVGKNTMTNVGTYNIPVYESKDSEKMLFNIWCFDSGNYNPDDNYGGYGYVLPEQLDWYEGVSNVYREENGGEPLPSIAFQHIVPPQIFRALKEVPEGTPGAVYDHGKYFVLPDGVDPETNWLSEAPCPPNVNFAPGYAQVDKMIEQGDVCAIFFGHDHINSYIVPYEGIDLVSSPGCTVHSYNDAHRGFRTITIHKDDPRNYDTETFTVYEAFEGNAMRTMQLKVYDFFNKIVNFFKDLWNYKIKPIFDKR